MSKLCDTLPMSLSISRTSKPLPAHRRHDIDDRAWALLEPHLPGRKGTWGGIARDNRNFINAVFWILRTGAPWRDLPPDYGDWKNTHRRFCRWRDKGLWESLLEALINEPDYEWLMIDASHCKVHPHAAGARGGNQSMSRTKGGSTARYIWPWMRMVCRSELLLQKAPALIAHKLAH
jgi:transposase